MTDTKLAERIEAPLCDNLSGLWCRACRNTGLFHCQHPEDCGSLEPMRHHADCPHPDRAQEAHNG